MSDETTMLTDQDIESALEAYRGLSAQRRQWEKADMILTALQGAKNYLAASRHEADAMRADAERAKQAAAETTRQAAVDGERLVALARGEVERLKGEATLLQGDKDRLTGEMNDLQATKAKLLSDVQRLTKTVADLEAIR